MYVLMSSDCYMDMNTCVNDNTDNFNNSFNKENKFIVKLQ